MSVQRAQKEINSAEFAEWMAYYRLEPFGEERADLRSAIVAWTQASSNRSKNSPPYKLADFMPKFGPRRRQTWQEIKHRLKMFTKAYNQSRGDQ